MWSLYESIPEEEKAKRISAWEENDKKFREIAEKMGSNGNDSSKSLIATYSLNIL